MRVCVLGLWHLGCVTAGCVAEKFPVVACDPSASLIADLQAGQPPLFEPGLKELIQSQTAAGRLAFTADVQTAVSRADVIWISFDTPVDDNDAADFEFVARQIRGVFRAVPEGATILISSQVPVGFTAAMEAEFREAFPQRSAGFAYSPENLRLGAALDCFRNPQRIVVGVRSEADRHRLEPLLGQFSKYLEWMSVESAEMTKHALNAFLANSIAFINEVATLGELVGANAKEVERGLKSDIRIGRRAYLGAGGAFAGGTLARDVSALAALADRTGIPAPLLKAIYSSNQAHKEWPRRKLQQLLGDLNGKRIAVLGLTYKPGTDTLRRSSAVELCRWLAAQRASVQAYDPTVRQPPAELDGIAATCGAAGEALTGADAAVITTEWPEFKNLSSGDLQSMRRQILVDPNHFLEDSLSNQPNIVYAAVGRPGEPR